jgi:hypothetical protein
MSPLKVILSIPLLYREISDFIFVKIIKRDRLVLVLCTAVLDGIQLT